MEVILRAGRRFVKALASNSGRQSPEEPRQKKQVREKTNPSLRPIAGKNSVLAGDVLEINGPAGSNRRRSRSGNISERQVRIALLAEGFGRFLGLPRTEIRSLYLAGLLHDSGS